VRLLSASARDHAELAACVKQWSDAAKAVNARIRAAEAAALAQAERATAAARLEDVARSIFRDRVRGGR